MKYLILSIILFIQINVFAQADTTIYDTQTVEIKAQTPLSSEEEWMNTLVATLQYPSIAREYMLQGRVILEFVIEKNGILSNIRVVHLRSNKPDVAKYWNLKNKVSKKPIDVEAKLTECEKALENAAIDMMKSSAPFKPAQIKGQNVRCKYVFPVSFKLE